MKNKKTEGVVAVIVGILLMGSSQAITGVAADILNILGFILLVFGIVRFFKKQQPKGN